MSEFSPLDGTGTANQYSHQAYLNGQTWLGLTDHGRLGGALDHIHACRHPEQYDNPLDPGQKRTADETILPIIGMEAFWRPDRFMDLTDKEKYGKNGHNWAGHLCIHALNMRGWHTLMRLSSKSWVRREDGGGYYGKACVDLDMLQEDNEGISISTACISSPLSRLILAGDDRGARKLVKAFQKIAGDHLWFELMPHDLDQQRTVNIEYVNLGQEFGIPCIATSDAHTPYKKWKDTHSIVRMITYKQSFNSQEQKADAGEDTYTEEIDTAYLCTAEELKQQFLDNHPDLPESVIDESMENTFDFVSQSKWFVISKAIKMPKLKVDVKKALREWCEQGLQHLFDTYPDHHWDKWSKQSYRERFEYEWNVLVGKNVLDYFYIVGDFVRWAKSDLPLPQRDKNGKLFYPKGEKKKPIRVGLGRGSAAGCLVSKLIGITAIDPISHDLLFERFLNPDRVGMPDIDMDFEGGELGRELVKEYLRIVYGHDHVADVIAYTTFTPKVTLKELGSVFDLNKNKVKEVIDTIGDIERGLEKIASINPVVGEFKEDHPDLWVHALRLEDSIKSDSKHAGAILVTEKPVNRYLSTQLGKDEKSTVTSASDRIGLPVVSMYGLIKYDVLGVTALNKQQLAVDLIAEHFGDIVEPNDLPPLRDPNDVEGNVMDGFIKGTSVGVFQFGGRGITQLLRHIKPQNTTDIAVANALYRPGPIKMAFEYGDRKNGKMQWELWHESLEPVLGLTYGIIAFQEQVMQICRMLGNYTGGQADGIRKAISKWYRLGKDVCIEKLREEGYEELWMQGCRDNGITDKDAWYIWEQILEFAGYGFNKSHSDSYGLQAYQDMWLKVNYPLAFYASLLTIEKKAKADEQIMFMKSVFREALEFKVEAAPPDINKSGRGWGIDGNKIRYGLVSVKDVGGANVVSIEEHRPYRDFDHYMSKVPSGVGVGVTKSLAKAGAFDEIADRDWLLARTPKREDGAAEIKIKMTCGCLKSRTIKPEGGIDMPYLIDRALEEIECPKHLEAEVKDWKRLDDTITVIEYYKLKGEEPEDPVLPTQDELNEAEVDVLGLSLTADSVVNKYRDFMSERIFTEPELEEIRDRPKAFKGEHRDGCKCRRCQNAMVVVGGEVTNIKDIKTSKGDPMGFVDFTFGASQFSCTLFPKVWDRYEELINTPGAFLVGGYKDASRGSMQIIVTEIERVEEVAAEVGWSPDKKKLKKKVAA